MVPHCITVMTYFWLKKPPCGCNLERRRFLVSFSCWLFAVILDLDLNLNLLISVQFVSLWEYAANATCSRMSLCFWTLVFCASYSVFFSCVLKTWCYCHVWTNKQCVHFKPDGVQMVYTCIRQSVCGRTRVSFITCPTGLIKTGKRRLTDRSTLNYCWC